MPQHDRSSFPGVEHLPMLSIADAECALVALRALRTAGLVDVYPVDGSHPTRWYVWRETTQERTPLSAWATSWLAHHALDDDGAPSEAPAADRTVVADRREQYATAEHHDEPLSSDEPLSGEQTPADDSTVTASVALIAELERLRADYATLEDLRTAEYNAMGADLEHAQERIRALQAENAAMLPIVYTLAMGDVWWGAERGRNKSAPVCSAAGPALSTPLIAW
jgi:hypothetical protein